MPPHVVHDLRILVLISEICTELHQSSSLSLCQVINFYLNLVMARTEQQACGRKVYCFSTFFFPKLHGGGHTAVRRWTKSVDLFLYDIILIPLHLGVHWSLAVSRLLAFLGYRIAL